MRLLAALGPLVLVGCSLVDAVAGEPGPPYELRCHDLDAATCGARATEIAAEIGGPGVVIESIDIGREGYGVCWRQPGPGPGQWVAGCADGVYPDTD